MLIEYGFGEFGIFETIRIAVEVDGSAKIVGTTPGGKMINLRYYSSREKAHEEFLDMERFFASDYKLYVMER